MNQFIIKLFLINHHFILNTKKTKEVIFVHALVITHNNEEVRYPKHHTESLCSGSTITAPYKAQTGVKCHNNAIYDNDENIILARSLQLKLHESTTAFSPM